MKRNMLRRAAAALLLLTLACSCVQAQGAVAWGSRGNDVSRVQSKLKQYGYYSGAVDGIFGQATYDAVIWFQKKNSLKADGVVGSATAAALGLSLNGGSVSAAAATESEAYLLARLVHGEARRKLYGQGGCGGGGAQPRAQRRLSQHHFGRDLSIRRL